MLFTGSPRRMPTVRLLLAAVAVLSGSLVTQWGAGSARAAKTVPYVTPPPPTAPDPMPARPEGRLMPKEGALFGIHTTPDGGNAKSPDDMGIDEREVQLGRKLDIDNHYYGWTATLPTWREQWDIAEGRIPLISWMGGDTIQIYNGKFDDLIGQRAEALKALGVPFFLRWFWEADGARSTKADVAHSPADYVKAWRHMRSVFDAHGATNAVWVWCPVSLNFYKGVAQPFYPGDDVVDWICADGYDWAPGKPGTRYEPFQELFQAFYDFGSSHHKPLMVGETGVQENNPGDKANWIRAMHVAVKQHYPLVEAFLYFDVAGANQYNYDWQVDTGPEALQAFREMAQDPYFNVQTGSGGSTPGPTTTS